MKNIQTIIIILIAVCCFACETVVDVHVPLETPKITINSLFSSDSVFTVMLHKSKFVLDEGDFQSIENANVVVKENGQPFDILTYAGNNVYRSMSERKPSTGKVYEIEASASGMESVKGESLIPEQALIQQVTYERRSGQSNDRVFDYVIDVTLKDNPDSENFYQLIVYSEFYYVDFNTQDTIYQQYPTFVFTDDPAFTEAASDKILFDDKLFNGKEVKISLKGTDFRATTKAYVHVLTLSRDLFKYKLTTDLQRQSSGDPFAQPVLVYNNINKGFGIFAGYNETVFEIKP
jgi:hypothetical protein